MIMKHFNSSLSPSFTHKTHLYKSNAIACVCVNVRDKNDDFDVINTFFANCVPFTRFKNHIRIFVWMHKNHIQTNLKRLYTDRNWTVAKNATSLLNRLLRSFAANVFIWKRLCEKSQCLIEGLGKYNYVEGYRFWKKWVLEAPKLWRIELCFESMWKFMKKKVSFGNNLRDARVPMFYIFYTNTFFYSFSVRFFCFFVHCGWISCRWSENKAR